MDERSGERTGQRQQFNTLCVEVGQDLLGKMVPCVILLKDDVSETRKCSYRVSNGNPCYYNKCRIRMTKSNASRLRVYQMQAGLVPLDTQKSNTMFLGKPGFV
ncbi:hypothetical protein TNCV_4861871 [Trichonephila clavipes]|nr:hypothetical protein TNCV_4861871 [Trichonephila clavipes]